MKRQFTIWGAVVFAVAFVFFGISRLSEIDYNRAAVQADKVVNQRTVGDECAVQGFSRFRLLQNGDIVCYDVFNTFKHIKATERPM